MCTCVVRVIVLGLSVSVRGTVCQTGYTGGFCLTWKLKLNRAYFCLLRTYMWLQVSCLVSMLPSYSVCHTCKCHLHVHIRSKQSACVWFLSAYLYVFCCGAPRATTDYLALQCFSSFTEKIHIIWYLPCFLCFSFQMLILPVVLWFLFKQGEPVTTLMTSYMIRYVHWVTP